MELNQLLPDVEAIVRKAGAKIMQIYSHDIEVNYKKDASPVTAADLAAHNEIMEGLSNLTPDVPILSEESDDDFTKNPPESWIIDPLDGTKEFIKKNGEFTVNIALVKNQQPLLGVVFAPALDLLYSGIVGVGATKISHGLRQPIIAKANDKPLTIAISRSHANLATQEFLNNMGSPRTLSMGSSLKMCLVAEGEAQLYPRFGITTEWDTAAADAIVKAAGGKLTKLDGQPLKYNKPDPLNPFFIASTADAPEWESKLPKS